MGNVTRILDRLGHGQEASAELLPIIYEELRKLAAKKLSGEKAAQSVQPTMLVHEAYIRLVDQDREQTWDSRGHFFSAAAEAMRRILVEHARRRNSLKRGGNFNKVGLELVEPTNPADQVVDLLALDDALRELEESRPEKAKLVKLRYFAGLTVTDAARAMNISESTAERHWKFAKAWLYAKLNGG